MSVPAITDDYSADRLTTGTVKVGGSITGAIETGGDRDWFAVTFKAGRWYRFDVEGNDAGSGALTKPAQVMVIKPNGQRVTEETTILPGQCWMPEADVTYWLEVRGQTGDTGGYRLSVVEVADDFAGGTATTGAVAVGGTATGELEHASDRDWFKVTLEKGKTYRIDLKGKDTGDGTLADPNLRGVYDSNGQRIDNSWDDDDGKGRNSFAKFTAKVDGVHYIEADAATDWALADRSPWIGTYKLSVVEVPPDLAAVPPDLAADASTTGTVAVGGEATGGLEHASDSDWFAVTLEKGKTYTIELKGKDTGDGTLKDPYLDGVYGADGNRIGSSWDYDSGEGRNSLVTFTAEANGTHYVAAGASGDSAGTYTLSVAEVPPAPELPAARQQEAPAAGQQETPAALSRPAEAPDDFTAGTGTSGTVAVGGEATGEIERDGDSDWFAVTLEAGKTYLIDLKGKDTGDGTLEDPYLDGVYGADGNRIGSSWDTDGGEGRNSLVTFTAGADGTHYVAAGASRGKTGTYTLSVAVDPDLAADASTSGTVAVGGEATGEIERDGDRDWFAVTLEKGKTYTIELKGRPTGDGTLRDPYLDGVYGADGNRIGVSWNNDGGEGRNSLVTFTAGADGTHYVAAGASRGKTGTYTLSVAEDPDLAADASTTGTVAVGGEAMGEIERDGDSDWFKVTLEKGKTYTIELKGRPTGDGTLKDPYLDGVYGADGNRIGSSWDTDGGEGRNSLVTFTAGADGTHYVAAGASRGKTGTYTLSVAEVPDDFAAGTGTSGTVAVGGEATGEIERDGDSDWFAVTLEAGKTYLIDLKGKDTGDGTLEDPYLDGVYGADGNRIGSSWDTDGGEGSNSLVTFTAGAGGTYYVAASASRGKMGTYTLSVAEVPDDFAAGTGTSGTVAVGGEATGEIERDGDRDWFKVTLEKGKTYTIELKGRPTGDGTLRDPYLDGVYGADGNRIGSSWDTDGGEGRNSLVTFTAGADGTHYVAAGASRGKTGTYTLSVAEDPDLAADASTTGTVAVGGEAAGEIEQANDSDWFAVTLEAGKTYTIELKGKDTGDGTLRDPYLDGVYGADGNRIGVSWDYDDGEGRNSLVTFTAAADGTYYVAASASRGKTGTYTLSVAEDPDLAANASTTGTVAVGGEATGEIERASDRDWFAVTLEAGKTYTIELKGRPTRDGTLRDPYLDGVYGADGNLIGVSWDNDSGKGRNSLVTFTAAADGTYYVAAGASEGKTGTYTLSVAEDPDLAADASTTGTVAVGGTATGEIEHASDRDWFAVTLEAGKTYRIDLKGKNTGDGTLADPYLDGVYGANGNRIGVSWDYDSGEGRNSLVTFTAAADGAYYVAAGSSRNKTGTYTLSVAEVPSAPEAPAARQQEAPAVQAPAAEDLDDYAADAGTTGTVAVGGTATGEIERANDSDWFAVTLEAGKTYQIELKGKDTGDGTLADPYLDGVYGANGSRIGVSWDYDSGEGRNSQVTFTAEADGTYYVVAGASGGSAGTYMLSVVEDAM